MSEDRGSSENSGECCEFVESRNTREWSGGDTRANEQGARLLELLKLREERSGKRDVLRRGCRRRRNWSRSASTDGPLWGPSVAPKRPAHDFEGQRGTRGSAKKKKKKINEFEMSTLALSHASQFRG